MSNKKAKKDKVGRPSSGENVKSQGKNGIMDITRKVTGLDDYDSLNLDFIGEVLGLPTVNEMEGLVKREIENII